MSIRNLDKLFRPASVAVFGASAKPRSVGTTVMHNLLAGGFAGPIMPVNPKYESVGGVLAYPDVASLPKVPDLAVICTPAATVPGIIAELGERGTRAAVVLSAGLDQVPPGQTRSLQEQTVEAARAHLLRILGPNCVGLIVPGIGLNASFAHQSALPGKLAFVTQSGALATAILDWARSAGIGFSHFISLGNSADVDFGDVLDYLGADPGTRGILLYIESIGQARKFMSAARAAARNKPVLAVKAGRSSAAAKAAASHTGALAGSDVVYDAAIRRAGMLRVSAIEDLFAAVETLGRSLPVTGDRLTILTNGGGPGVMATDALVAAGGRMAELSQETMAGLDAVLPATWSRGNPVDIIGDAPVERYVDALRVLARDPGSDAILFIHAPTAIVPSEEIARGLVPVVKECARNVLACWLGRDAVAAARRIFSEAGIATYDTPEDAVDAFMQLVDYRRNQDMLLETPSEVPEDFTPDAPAARRLIDQALDAGRDMLSEPEAKAVLAAYGIPVVRTRRVDGVDGAVAAAAELGFPVALKVVSNDISHKSDVGGVVLDLHSAEAVRSAAQRMIERIAQIMPHATVEGFSVQQMARRPGAHELIVGTTTDAVFGPVVLFGQGGTAVEVVRDQALGLPPLNMRLAADMVARTRVSRLLAGYRSRPPAKLEAIYTTVIRIAQLVADLPQVLELDINPLLADEQGVLALDARMRVARREVEGHKHLAIRPYPRKLEEEMNFRGRPILLRPIRPEDEPAHREFFSRLHPEDVRFRFFGQVREFAHTELARYTQIDYDREMAFIATARAEDGRPETLGVVRVLADPDNIQAEFAIIVRSDMKGLGLGSALLDKMIRYCRERGTQALAGQVLSANQRMLKLAGSRGFERTESREEGVVHLRLSLQ